MSIDVHSNKTWHEYQVSAGRKITLAERISSKGKAKREQEDAQEFLGFLLDSTQEELIILKQAYSQLLNLQGLICIPGQTLTQMNACNLLAGLKIP